MTFLRCKVCQCYGYVFTGGRIQWQPIKKLSLFSLPGFGSAFRLTISGSPDWPSSRDVPQAVLRHPVLLREWWEHTFRFCIAVKANILSVGLFTHYEPDSRAAEAQRDVTELGFSQVLNGCEQGKSHSCEFFHLQVSLAESRQQRTSKPLFHTVFQPNSSLYILGFKIEFVRLKSLMRTIWKLILWIQQHFAEQHLQIIFYRKLTVIQD